MYPADIVQHMALTGLEGRGLLLAYLSLAVYSMLFDRRTRSSVCIKVRKGLDLLSLSTHNLFVALLLFLRIFSLQLASPANMKTTPLTLVASAFLLTTTSAEDYSSSAAQAA